MLSERVRPLSAATDSRVASEESLEIFPLWSSSFYVSMSSFTLFVHDHFQRNAVLPFSSCVALPFLFVSYLLFVLPPLVTLQLLSRRFFSIRIGSFAHAVNFRSKAFFPACTLPFCSITNDNGLRFLCLF